MIVCGGIFPGNEAVVMILLYTAGIVVGILSALVLNHTAFRGNPIPFVMELPNYRFPSAKSVGQLIWDKAKDFLERAFTIIFVATIVIWFLQTFDLKLNVVTDSEKVCSLWWGSGSHRCLDRSVFRTGGFLRR